MDAKEKIARLYLEHVHRICAHQATELVKAFVQQNMQPIMAPLPALRFQIEETKFPLVNTGLDFMQAVHLETCSDLNTDSFLNAYRWFTCRRCQPILLYSDNGKTFLGASEEIKKSVKALDKGKIYKALAAVKTTWIFNPPYGPYFGGAWERLIQSVKRHS